MRTKKLNNKGFTLVEVIVVAVIVAVLALVGIQLYQGYVEDARKNTAENLAASVASFAQNAYNAGMTETAVQTMLTGGATAGATLTDNTGSTDKVLQLPAGATISHNATTYTVSATINTTTSTGAYKWK